MAEFPVTEAPNGDLILTVGDTTKRIVARRERPTQACRPILVDGTLILEGVLAGRLQLSAIKYVWPDGYEKWGPYIGSIHALEEDATR